MSRRGAAVSLSRVLRWAACAVLAASAASCSKPPAPGAGDATTARSADAAPPAAPAASPPAQPDPEQHRIIDDALPRIAGTAPVDTAILEVHLSDHGDGQRLTGIVTDHFNRTDGVFLSIRTRGTASKYTLSSKWLDPSGKTLTEYSQNIATAGQVDTVFSLSRPDGWPRGAYTIALAINGRPLRTVPFTVQ